MKSLKRIFQMSLPFRWVSSALFLLNSIRIHPSVLILGNKKNILIQKKTIISKRTVIDVMGDGCVELGESVWLAPDIQIETNARISIGDGTTIQRRCSINGQVRIGRGCILAPNVFISSGSHIFRFQPDLPIRVQESMLTQEERKLFEKPVWIQDDCWLGTNSVICPGVTIGKGSVIGANSVVTCNVPPYTIMAGAPARSIGQRLSWKPKKELQMNCPEDWIFLLSGEIIMGVSNAPAVLKVSRKNALFAALDHSVESVFISYEVAADTNITVGNLEYKLLSTEKSIVLPVTFGVENSWRVLEIKISEIGNCSNSFIKIFEIKSAS